MEIDDSTNPLIWTEVGYMRTADLVLTPEWEMQTLRKPAPWWKFWLSGVDEPRFAGVALALVYRLDGVIVRRDVYVFKVDGATAVSEQSEIGK